MIFAIIALALHLAGKIPFAISGEYIRILNVLGLVSMLFLIVYEHLGIRNRLASQLLPPAIIFTVLAIVDILNNLYLNWLAGNAFLQIGLLIFTIWVSVFAWRVVVQNFDRAQKAEELALEVATMGSNLEKQRSLYSRLTEVTESVRTMRHDLRHQLSALRAYLLEGDNQGALEYLNKLDNNNPNFQKLLISDNFAVNAVVSHYMSMAEEDEIQCDIQLVVPAEVGRIDDNDLAIIFGNLYENAIDASMYLQPSKRFIKMRSQVAGKKLTMTIDNTFDGAYRQEDGHFLSRKHFGRGIGLSSVRTIVERYDGSIKVEAANGVFMVSLYVVM
jgi:sensor histidine kinase regulating citrate/malate metabolism